SLVDRLAEFGFTDESLNVGTLYRTLRRLEKGGFAASDWESSGRGPRRRVYTITKEGQEALATWMEIIRGNKNRIKRLLARYEADEQ
ncbi:MAG: PadR family transcriptional regulator, partial [Firmicutes bacterium]|nr:PadR family transcriptional regulator [Bacillota bacterium]